MNMTNLREGNGFVNREDLFRRMAFARPAPEDHYRFFKVPNSDFSVLSTAEYNPLFRIYTGNEELYGFIRDMAEDVAKQLGCEFKAAQWRPNDDPS